MSAAERMAVTLSYDTVDRRWSISGTPPGPAGFADLRLTDDVKILVDVVEPERLVELTGTLAGSGSGAVLPSTTQRLVAALLGGTVAARLARLIREGEPEEQIDCEPPTALGAVGRLALLERLRETADAPSPWWAAEAAVLANEVDHPRFIAYAREEARQAALMLAAMATVPDQWFRELSDAVVDRFRRLADAVEQLLGVSVIEEHGDLQRARRDVSLLVERLARLPTLHPDEADELDDRTWATVRSRQRITPADDLLPATPVALPERWRSHSGQDRGPFRVPLHTFREQITPGTYRRLLPDAALEVFWPPSMPVRVSVPVQPGIRSEELDDLFLRVFDADSGELLGAAELELVPGPAAGDGVDLDSALSAEVELPRTVTVDDRRRPPARLKVDVTCDLRTSPLSSEQRRRRKAIRTGMLAARAARLGDHRAAEHGWRACAAHWHALKEHRQHRLAEQLAAEAAERRNLARHAHAGSWFAGECLPLLVDAWADEQLSLAERLSTTDPPAGMQLARMVIEVLEPSLPRLPLAAARLFLARLLAEEGADWAARKEVRRAQLLFGRLNHRRGLEDCQRLLGRLQPEQPDDLESRRFALGVSILRDELVGVLSDQLGTILDVRRQRLTAISPTDVAAEVAELVHQLLETGRELDEKIETRTIALGVELGGPVNHEAGEVVFYSPYRTDPVEGLISDDLTWQRVPFARLLAEATGIDSVVENDANALAAFELAFGHGQAQHFAVLLVGDGIGCGLVVDHKLYRGAGGAAGELGHIVVPRGRKCASCEREGCLDSLAAVRAILANIGHLKGQGPIPDLQAAIDLLRRGDKAAWDAFEEAGDALAHATADMVNVHAPSRIILRASASMLEPDNPFLQAFKTFTKDRFLQIPDAPEVFLEPLRLTDGTRGAVLVALQRFSPG